MINDRLSAALFVEMLLKSCHVRRQSIGTDQLSATSPAASMAHNEPARTRVDDQRLLNNSGHELRPETRRRFGNE